MTAATDYTDELAIDICVKLAEGEPLSKIAKREGMPSLSTIYRWIRDQPTFRELYSNARVDMAHTLFNEIIEIADEAPLVVEHEGEMVTIRFDSAAVARNRERIHARQFACVRLLPRVYGDKLAIGGADDMPPLESQDPVETARRIAFLLAAGVHSAEGQREPLLLLGPAKPAEPTTHGTALDGTKFRYETERPAPIVAEIVEEEEPGLMWSTVPTRRPDEFPRVLRRRPY